MHLKSYLREHIGNTLVQLREQITDNEEALQLLGKVDLKKANYVVSLESLWANEGEKSTATQHTGSLEEAIGKAEQEFKTLNNRGDVQAKWLVEIELGQNRYSVPEEYWVQYREKRK